MGLFVKKGNVGTHVPMYHVGLQTSVIIVGLGNPGKEYNHTRHNIGFDCLDFFAENNEFPAWVAKKDMKCHITYHNMGATRVILVKPTTFMNLSGEAVQAVQKFYKVPPEQTVVVHDELDIPFGQIRIRRGGGSAGNNGLKSIIQHGGQDTWRVRIGTQNALAAQADSSDFVLSRFTDNEQTQLKYLKGDVNAILTEYIYGGQLALETRTFIVT